MLCLVWWGGNAAERIERDVGPLLEGIHLLAGNVGHSGYIGHGQPRGFTRLFDVVMNHDLMIARV